ncbi:MAG: flagellar protein FlaG [Gammaproteobacteria bacterium]|nr:flagellar protein FlaG [Gammaproteobacteria bacterium]
MVIQPVNQSPVTEVRTSNGQTSKTTGSAEAAPQRQELPSSGGSVPVTEQAATEQSSDLQETLDSLTQRVQSMQRDLQFSVDKHSGQTVVKVIDSETDEVIRQIPAEEVLALAQRLDEASGMLLKTEA